MAVVGELDAHIQLLHGRLQLAQASEAQRWRRQACELAARALGAAWPWALVEPGQQAPVDWLVPWRAHDLAIVADWGPSAAHAPLAGARARASVTTAFGGRLQVLVRGPRAHVTVWGPRRAAGKPEVRPSCNLALEVLWASCEQIKREERQAATVFRLAQLQARALGPLYVLLASLLDAAGLGRWAVLDGLAAPYVGPAGRPEEGRRAADSGLLVDGYALALMLAAYLEDCPAGGAQESLTGLLAGFLRTFSGCARVRLDPDGALTLERDPRPSAGPIQVMDADQASLVAPQCGRRLQALMTRLAQTLEAPSSLAELFQASWHFGAAGGPPAPTARWQNSGVEAAAAAAAAGAALVCAQAIEGPRVGGWRWGPTRAQRGPILTNLCWLLAFLALRHWALGYLEETRLDLQHRAREDMVRLKAALWHGPARADHLDQADEGRRPLDLFAWLDEPEAPPPAPDAAGRRRWRVDEHRHDPNLHWGPQDGWLEALVNSALDEQFEDPERRAELAEVGRMLELIEELREMD